MCDDDSYFRLNVISPLSVDVRGPDGGVRVPAGRKRQDGAVACSLHPEEPSLAAASGQLAVHQPHAREGAAGCADRPKPSAPALRGSSLHLTALQRFGHCCGLLFFFFFFFTFLCCYWKRIDYSFGVEAVTLPHHPVLTFL